MTALGFRYLVMELVDGKPLTEYCSGKPEREKLRLFLDVCEAVQYAHRSLVVHRDLKPDNILVTSEGRVKTARLRDCEDARSGGRGGADAGRAQRSVRN